MEAEITISLAIYDVIKQFQAAQHLHRVAVATQNMGRPLPHF
jgi:hypothetical protein